MRAARLGTTTSIGAITETHRFIYMQTVGKFLKASGDSRVKMLSNFQLKLFLLLWWAKRAREVMVAKS